MNSCSVQKILDNRDPKFDQQISLKYNEDKQIEIKKQHVNVSE